MSGRTSASPEWEQFRSKLAEVAEIAPEEIHQSSRLIGDLELDSLALAELVVMLIDEYKAVTLYKGLEVRPWDDMSAGELFSEVQPK